MPKRMYFTQSKEAVLTNTTLDYIILDRAEEGEELHYEKIGVANLTTANTKAHVGIRKGGKDIWLETLTLTTAGNYYSPRRVITVTAGDQLIVGFAGITANDKCIVNVNGYRVKNAGL